ncbi:MAG: tRNA lysidine(34) synthetase TilS, partial [Flavobacteriaceae bacterium]|nr:tRNA lysidine(34) synthetase TilS [Flavobacteriaceae bacterium]
MLSEFKNHLNNNLPFLKESKLLIAVSGGIDSIVLLHLCKQANLDIALAHCNFNLRGKESDTDETFVLELGNTLNLEVFTQGFDTKDYAKAHKQSIQMAARELRYQWFEDLLRQLEFDYILTAHHADDNLETFLINLSRGTGLEGLTGIPEVKNTLVRPLLPFSRQELEDFANAKNISWREDASNLKTKYLRNKLRHEVIPILKGINPQILQNFQKSISYLQESQIIVNDRIDEVSDTILNIEGNAIQLDINAIQKLNNPKAYLYEILKDYGFTDWQDVVNLLNAQTGKYVVSQEWRLLKNRKQLVLTKLDILKDEFIEILDFDNLVDTFIGSISFTEVPEIEETDSNTIFVDKAQLKLPLIIRKKREGDTFVPFGMKGSKK